MQLKLAMEGHLWTQVSFLCCWNVHIFSSVVSHLRRTICSDCITSYLLFNVIS